MRILVGTMYAGERERDRCLAAVARQTLPAAEHLVIEHLPKREAHERLYGTFVARRGEFDLLIKVDADMVLCRDDLFAGIAACFDRRPGMELLSVKVHDWFTDRPMNGLNSYRNTIGWSPSGDVVFTDQFGAGGGGKAGGGLGGRDKKLAPAAWHCPDPGLFQAFHFGIHRGVKAAVAADRGMHESAYMRWRELAWTWRHFRQAGDVRLGLASLGGELGVSGEVGPDQLDYADPGVRAAFEAVQDRDAAWLADEVRRRRRAAVGGAGPWWWRMECRRGGRWPAVLGRALMPVPARKAATITRRRLGLN